MKCAISSRFRLRKGTDHGFATTRNEQMSDMKNNGNNAVIANISLEGTPAVVPEPATASLGLLGLAALMMRRRRA